MNTRKKTRKDKPTADLETLLAWIGTDYEQRRDLLGTATGLTNRLKAIVKSRSNLPRDTKITESMIRETDYPPLVVLVEARAHIREAISVIEKRLEKNAKELPGYSEIWAYTCGLGALGLALVVGATGDLRNYSSVAKVWKRMGLHVYDGKALWLRRPNMSADAWSEAGYNPQRRSIMYQIVNLGICTKANAYHELRDNRREYEKAKVEALGIKVVPAAQIPKNAAPGTYMSEGHILNRANRYVGKRLLKDLWKVWRSQPKFKTQTTCARPPSQSHSTLETKRRLSYQT